MIFRRMYFRHKSYTHRFKPEIKTWHELCSYMKENEDEPVWAMDNATYFIDKTTRAEQEKMWKSTVHMVMQNPRFVLDNLHNIIEYKVNWNSYVKKNPLVGLPPQNLDVFIENVPIKTKHL